MKNEILELRPEILARDLFIAVAVYSVAILVFSIVPVMVGVLMDRQSLTASQAGLVSGMDMLGAVIPGFLLGAVLPRSEKRTLLAVGCVALAIGNLLSLTVNGFSELLLTRTVSGLGAGFLFACANAMLASNPDPVRAYGLASVGGTILGAFMLFALPFLIGRFDTPGFYLPLAVLAATCIALVVRAPRDPLVPAAASISADGWTIGKPRLVLLAAGTMLLVIPQQAYWGFAERIGLRAGASPEMLGTVFSVSYVFGLLASGIATWISTRWGLMRMLALGFGLQGLAIITVCLVTDRNLIFGSIILQTFAICFGAPYLFGLGAQSDESGRFASMVVGLFFFTMAIGAMLGGVLVESAGFPAVARLTAVATILGMMAVLPAAMAVRARRLGGRPRHQV